MTDASEKVERGFAEIKAYQCRLCGEIYEGEPPELDDLDCIYPDCPGKPLTPPEDKP